MKTRDDDGLAGDGDDQLGDDLDLELDDNLDIAEDPPEPDPDDPPEPDADAEDPPEPVEQRRRPTQSQRLREREATTRRENEELRRRLDVLERRPAPPAADPAAQRQLQEQFFESLELLAPKDAYRTLWERATQQFQGQMAQAEFRGMDRADRVAYEAQTRSSKVHADYADKVEAAIAEARRQGNFMLDRGTVLSALVGQDVIARAQRAGTQQRRQGAARVRQQTTRPSSPRGDVARGGTGRADPDAADEALLRGIRADEF